MSTEPAPPQSLLEAIERIPGEGQGSLAAPGAVRAAMSLDGSAWYHRHNFTAFCAVAEQLMLHGIGEDEVISILETLYGAVADEFGG